MKALETIELSKLASDELVESMALELEGSHREDARADSRWPARFLSAATKTAPQRWGNRFVAAGPKSAPRWASRFAASGLKQAPPRP